MSKDYLLMHSLRLLLIGAVAVLITSQELNAQLLNVERIRMDPDTTGWAGDIGFNLSLNRLSDQVVRMSTDSNLSYQSEQHTWMLLSDLNLVNVDGRSLVSNGYVHLRSRLFRNRKVSPELFLQYQQNANLGLNQRALAGSGLRYSFLNRSRINGSVFSGLMAEHEEWALRGDEAVTRNFVKSTTNISLSGEISPETNLQLIGYYQTRPDRPFEPRVTLESELLFRISRLLSFSVTFSMTYDADPVIEIRKLTYTLENGLVIHF